MVRKIQKMIPHKLWSKIDYFDRYILERDYFELPQKQYDDVVNNVILGDEIEEKGSTIHISENSENSEDDESLRIDYLDGHHHEEYRPSLRNSWSWKIRSFSFDDNFVNEHEEYFMENMNNFAEYENMMNEYENIEGFHNMDGNEEWNWDDLNRNNMDGNEQIEKKWQIETDWIVNQLIVNTLWTTQEKWEDINPAEKTSRIN